MVVRRAAPSSLPMVIRSIVEDAQRPRQQVIVKFLDKSTGGGLASVVGVTKVAWCLSDRWSTERLDPT